MKKIYTFIAVALTAMTANAQYDISISWNALTEGGTVTETEFEGGFTITNEGSPIAAGDSVLYGYRIDGEFYNMAFGGGANFTQLEEEWGTGESMSFDNGVVVTPPLDAEFCAVVHGVGIASLTTFLGDEDTDNNVSCVSISVVDDSGIEDLGIELSEIYVAGEQLMITNNGMNGEELVNLSIVNMNGQIVQVESLVMVQGTSSVAVSDLAPGIYVVSIEVNGNVEARKVSIQ